LSLFQDACHPLVIIIEMESDRAQTDLGKVHIEQVDAEKQEKPKQPKKRFIGRKAAAENAERRGDPNGTIEDSGAVQGLSFCICS